MESLQARAILAVLQQLSLNDLLVVSDCAYEEWKRKRNIAFDAFKERWLPLWDCRPAELQPPYVFQVRMDEKYSMNQNNPLACVYLLVQYIVKDCQKGWVISENPMCWGHVAYLYEGNDISILRNYSPLSAEPNEKLEQLFDALKNNRLQEELNKV